MKIVFLLLGILLHYAGTVQAGKPVLLSETSQQMENKTLRHLLAVNAPYRNLEILSGTNMTLSLVRSYGIQTKFDIVGDGNLEPVDVIHYTSPDQAFQDLIPGPTLVFSRGVNIDLTLQNTLNAAEAPVLSPKPGCPPFGSASDVWVEDVANDLFGTNLHTHGLHVDPTADHDDVLVNMPAGSTSNLEYTLNLTHPAGSFWYHAHRHDSVAYQVVNGMSGALIVPGQPSANPSYPLPTDDLESIPEIVAANNIPGVTGNFGRIMLIQQYRFDEAIRANGATTWVVDPGDISDRAQASSTGNSGTIVEGLNPAQSGPTRFEDILSVNGVRGPVITMQPGAVERWRFIDTGIENAISAQWYKLVQNNPTDYTGGGVTMYEIALDGIPTGYMDLMPTLTLYPGYRSDMLVQIAPNANPGDIYVLISQQAQLFNAKRFKNSRRMRASGDPLPADAAPPSVLAFVQIGSNPVSMNLPKPAAFARWQITTPIQPTYTQDVGFHFIDADPDAYGPHGATGEFGVTAGYAQKPYAQTIGVDEITLQIGRAEEWTMQVDNGEHPFHIHVNPFQVVDSRFPSQQRWVWRDSLQLSAAAGPVKIRLQPQDYTGLSVAHCHILDHEDQGMMKEINILTADGKEPDKTYFLQPVRTKDASELPKEVKPHAGKRQVVVVYTGVQCPHCASALRGLFAVSGQLENAEITALSTMPVPPDARKLMKVPAGDGVQLYPEVPGKETFERLHLLELDGTVKHAVLIFDNKGKETFRYTGDHPLPDVREITHALAQMAAAE